MKFADIQYLHIIWVVLFLFVLGHFVRRYRSGKYEFIHRELRKKYFSDTKNFGFFIKNRIEFIGLIFLIFAIAGFQYGKKLVKTKREAHQIVIAFDTSVSMLAEDIKPNRLIQAKIALKTILENLKGDQIALIAFAGDSFIQCPLTDDIMAVNLFLDDISTDTIPTQGTAISEALKISKKAFLGEKSKGKFLILITDGEETVGNPLEAAEDLKKDGVVVFTIGIGDKKGVPIPVKKKGNTHYLKDRQGNIVLTKLDENTLKKIADITGGKYFYSNLTKNDIDYITTILKKYKRTLLAKEEMLEGINRYYIPGSIALLLFVLAFLIPEKLWQKSEVQR